MGCSSGEGPRVNAFALVSYIPGPLGRFLDELRCELVPKCTAHSHVTILPPRILQSRPDESWLAAIDDLSSASPIEVELGEIEIFPVSQAIYLSIGPGFGDLVRLHDRLNTGRLYFDEPFSYHPHITLAQDVPAERVEEVAALARRKWAEADVPRRFKIEELTFVQNSIDPASGCSHWIDLTECDLGRPCKPWNWSDDGSLTRTSPFGPLASPEPSPAGGGAGCR